MGCLDIKPSLNEISPKFHIERAGKTSGEERYLYRNHFRVYYIVCGYVVISVKDGVGLRLGYGDICILPPDVDHTVRVKTTSTDYYVFTFSIDFVEHILQNQAGDGGVLSSLFNRREPIILGPAPSQMQLHLQNIMEFMKYEYDVDFGKSELTLRNCLATVFCVFLELQCRRQSEPSVEKGGILYAIHHIKTNYEKKLTSDLVAKLSNIPKKEFATKFKEFSGRSFHDFLNKVRIEKAVDILKTAGGDMVLCELADLCGYDNYVTFYRNFVKYTGTSPNAFLSDKE